VEFADASADAWTRVLRFIAAHAGTPAAQQRTAGYIA
jgi:hypothetical protein